jgi:hypothetical protein
VTRTLHLELQATNDAAAAPDRRAGRPVQRDDADVRNSRSLYAQGQR